MNYSIVKETRSILEESLRLNKNFAQTEVVFLRYLVKRMKQPIYRVGGADFSMVYRHGNDVGRGIRYVFMRPTMTSFRINWTSKRQVITPSSIDVFLKNQKKPSYRLAIGDVGIGAVVPMLVDVLLSREILTSDIPLVIDNNDGYMIDDTMSILPKTKTALNILAKKQKPESTALDLLRLGYNPTEVSGYAKLPKAVVDTVLRNNIDSFGSVENPRKRVVAMVKIITGRPDRQELLTEKANTTVITEWMKNNHNRIKNAITPAVSAVSLLARGKNFSLVVTGIDENNLRSPFVEQIANLPNTQVIDCTNLMPDDIVPLLWNVRNDDKATLVLLGLDRLIEDQISRQILSDVSVNRNKRMVTLKSKKYADYGSMSISDVEAKVASGGAFPNKFEFIANVVMVSDNKPTFIGNSITNPIVEVSLPATTVFDAIKDNMSKLTIGSADMDTKMACYDYLIGLNTSLAGFTIALFETSVVCRMTDIALFDRLFKAHNTTYGGVAEF